MNKSKAKGKDKIELILEKRREERKKKKENY